MDNELINRNAKRGYIDNVILGNGERHGFGLYYVLKIKHLENIETGIVIRETCISGGYRDLNVSEVNEEIQKRAYDRIPGFVEDYNKILL